ncbi:hypothetical protein E1A91_A10G116300v1 [Gossypium mustelinum]|uniref:Uncharacterized protein n=1 Tax=Gossypium mustelinum TaxID=34275 RepID=A0A5D2XKW8_GOSMU|nr:hypothetical protein E1A91_A10G116300v1 [Gossypium mustelinum]
MRIGTGYALASYGGCAGAGVAADDTERMALGPRLQRKEGRGDLGLLKQF